MSKKKLITSALPYVNNVPHLGNIIGCVLSADVYARYCRQVGYETLYICATDEYGTATENKAREEGLTPREICDKYHAIHKKVYEHFNIKFDYFGRTSYPEQQEIVHEIYHQLNDEEMIFEQESEQLYCEHDQMFLADRYVEGGCPSCHYEDARGDQCDNCGKLLHPTDLLKPKCKVCSNEPVMKSTKHLYLDLPKLEKKLAEWQDDSMEKGKWTKNAIRTTKAWIEAGLQARPITRDLKWGIPVPREGFENKVFYVWFDAPLGYISTTKRALPDTWKDWWQNADETELYQFMAKDNIPFHTVIFPACMIGTNKPWTKLHHINSTEYLNYEDGKFSKSRNLGVFGSDVIESDIPVDFWRFYLLSNRPEKSDTSFLWDSFFEEVNSNFIDNIGNLINRTLVFLNKNFDGEIKEIALDDELIAFSEKMKEMTATVIDCFEKVEIREALKNILAMGRAGNKFFQDQAPWKMVKEDREKTLATLTVLAGLIKDMAILLEAYIPETSAKMLSLLKFENASFGDLNKLDSLYGKKLDKPEILYKKLDPKKKEELKEKFSGRLEPEEEKEDSWLKLEIKVGQIKSVSKHPTADKLYVEEIDCGEDENRTIVSGLVKYVTEEDLLNKKVMVATNLAAAKLRGVVSEGMVLCAEHKKKLEVVDMADFEIGDLITRDDQEEHLPPAEITIDEFFDAELKVENGFITNKGKNLVIGDKPIRTEKVLKGKMA